MSGAAGGSDRPLFPPRNEGERAALLRYARETPLAYGEWRHLKALYKAAESGDEPELLGTLIGRLDAASLTQPEPLDGAFGRGYQEIPHGAAVLRGTTLYLAASERLHVIDVSVPTLPRVLGSCHCGRDRRVAVAGDRVYVGGFGFRVIDVSDPTAPRQVGVMTTRAIAGMAAVPPYLYLATVGDQRQPGGLMVVDISDPARPEQVAFLALGQPRDLVVIGRHAYVLDASAGKSWMPFRRSEGGVVTVDLTDPRRPRSVGSFNASAYGYLADAGGRLCLWTRDLRGYNSRLRLFDLADPGWPRETLTRLLPGSVHGVAVAGEWIAAVSDHRLQVVNLKSPNGPVGEAAFPPGHYNHCLAGGEGRLVAPSDERRIATYDLTDPASQGRPVRLGASPSAATLAYMKRRARRCLRDLAGRDTARFAEVAYHALAVAGRGHAGLDPASHWVSVDLLFGGSGRFLQARHGRGPLYALRPMPRRGREERAPAAWDARSDLVADLYTAPDLPWETRAVAMKILRAGGRALPALPPETLGRVLRSPFPPLLVSAARDGARQILAGAALPPETAARVFFASGGRARLDLASFWRERSEETAWDARFAESLARLAAAPEGDAGGVTAGEDAPIVLTARRVAATVLLAGPFAAAFAARGGFGARPALIAALLGSGRDDLLSLATSAVATARAMAALPWLAACARLPAARRERALAALAAGFKGTLFDLETARALVFSDLARVREDGWRLLAQVPREEGVVAGLWEAILAALPESAAARAALDSPDALALLGEARLSADALQERLVEHLLRARESSTEAFAHLARAVPAPSLMRAIMAMEDGTWSRLRDPLLEGLADPAWRDRFWEAVWATLPEDENGLLARRILADLPIAETFQHTDAEALFADAPAAGGGLLLRWARAHEARFERDSALLLAAATAPVPEVREWGLARARAVGMDLPFALRLMESGLPDAVAAGRDWFAAIPPGDEAELEAVLALCDSPDRDTRAFGRELAGSREGWPREEVLRRLSEHADPVTQEFVARALREAPALAGELAPFEQRVLRARDRARRAKEQVKARQSGSSDPDVALLLALARGRTRRDAEWALEQLARLAAEGRAIDGLAIDGTVG